MNTQLSDSIRNAKNFDSFCNSYNLTAYQQEQFITYASLLLQQASEINITTILNPTCVIRRHFEDSVVLSKAYELSKITAVADIGSGGGFPGIPLKIIAPWLSVVLIEVSHKKSLFLSKSIEALQLDHTAVSMLDWRTFLRKTTTPIDLFVARASLEPQELIRMFKPSSHYRHAQLVYWASQYWQPSTQDTHFLQKEFKYTTDRSRRLIFFGLKQ